MDLGIDCKLNNCELDLCDELNTAHSTTNIVHKFCNKKLQVLNPWFMRPGQRNNQLQ